MDLGKRIQEITKLLIETQENEMYDLSVKIEPLYYGLKNKKKPEKSECLLFDKDYCFVYNETLKDYFLVENNIKFVKEDWLSPYLINKNEISLDTLFCDIDTKKSEEVIRDYNFLQRLYKFLISEKECKIPYEYLIEEESCSISDMVLYKDILTKLGIDRYLKLNPINVFYRMLKSFNLVKSNKNETMVISDILYKVGFEQKGIYPISEENPYLIYRYNIDERKDSYIEITMISENPNYVNDKGYIEFDRIDSIKITDADSQIFINGCYADSEVYNSVIQIALNLLNKYEGVL